MSNLSVGDIVRFNTLHEFCGKVGTITHWPTNGPLKGSHNFQFIVVGFDFQAWTCPSEVEMVVPHERVNMEEEL